MGGITSGTKPYLVQQAVLQTTSEYFVKALRNDSFREGREGRLHFPDDDAEAWEVLLFWMLKRKIPDLGSEEQVLIASWALGDKYGIVAFQDEVMLETLKIFNDEWVLEETIAKAIRLCAPGSKMHKLVAEELVLQVYDVGMVDRDELPSMIEGTGILVEFLGALERYTSDINAFSHRLRRHTEEYPLLAHWTDYLDGEPPAKHWIFDCK